MNDWMGGHFYDSAETRADYHDGPVATAGVQTVVRNEQVEHRVRVERTLVGALELVLDVPHHHQTTVVGAEQVAVLVNAHAAHDVAMTLKNGDSRSCPQFPNRIIREREKKVR